MYLLSPTSIYSAVIYSIEYGDSCGLFTVNSTTGDLVLTTPPSHHVTASLDYGPLVIQALDVDVWRPSRTSLIRVRVRWTGTATRQLTSLASLRYDVQLLADSASTLAVFGAPATPLQLATPHHPAFTVSRGVLHLVAARITTPTSAPLVATVTYASFRRLILVDVAVNRTARYLVTPALEMSASISEASAVGTAVWFDHRVNTISNGNRFGWFTVEYSTGKLLLCNFIEVFIIEYIFYLFI